MDVEGLAQVFGAHEVIEEVITDVAAADDESFKGIGASLMAPLVVSVGVVGVERVDESEMVGAVIGVAVLSSRFFIPTCHRNER